MKINYLLIAMKSIISQKVNNNLVCVVGEETEHNTGCCSSNIAPNTYLVILKWGLSLGAGGEVINSLSAWKSVNCNNDQCCKIFLWIQ